MELRQLRYFAAVARRRHFTAAAEAIGVAQPALSQQIRLLERELRVDLFDRTGRRVRLTPAGEAFLVRAERVIVEVASAQAEMAEFAGAARGRVIVGTLPSLAEHQLPRLVAGFHARHPGLELILREERTANLLTLLGNGEVELALLHQPTTADAGITIEPLFTEELVAVVAPGHPLAGRDTLPDRRAARRVLHPDQVGLGDPRHDRRRLRPAGFAPRVAFESGGAATVRALAAAGLGVAILPRSEATLAGAVVVPIVLTPRLTRTVALAWAADRYHSVVATAFIALARSELAVASSQ